MKVFYFFNERLPNRTAHDVYTFLTCYGLARAGVDLTLFCAAGSAPPDELMRHYLPQLQGAAAPFRIETISRSLLGLGQSGRVFAWKARRHIAARRPQLAVFSTRKLAALQLRRKVPGVRYVYEAHQLAQYSSEVPAEEPHALRQDRDILRAADLIVITTQALDGVLRSPVFGFTGRSAVVPLGSLNQPLPPPRPAAERPLQLYYVGQLYARQGVGDLLDAVQAIAGVQLHVIGGSAARVQEYSAHAAVRSGRARLHGFVPPTELPARVAGADAFAAPFQLSDRMPYVAHTKLLDYARWGRPLLAPALPVVREHLPTAAHRHYLYDPHRPGALAQALAAMAGDRATLARITGELAQFARAHPLEFSLEQRSETYAQALRAP
jgi:glycosyltransferase involved in cell wall biosynthesis